MPLDQLPKCFVACALVPNQMNIPVEQARIIQQSLVSIWQSYIHDWYENPENLRNFAYQTSCIRKSY